MINLKPDLYALLKAVIGSETLVWADQNAPRPAFPYWTIRVNVGRALGHDWKSSDVTEDGDQTIKGVREATVNIQRIGAESDFYVSQFRDNLSKTTVNEQFILKDIALYDHADIQTLPFQIDATRYEPRATIDLFVRFGTELLDRVGVIDAMNGVIVDAEYITQESSPDVKEELSDILTITVNPEIV